jgi:hypothetical protein
MIATVMAFLAMLSGGGESLVFVQDLSVETVVVTSGADTLAVFSAPWENPECDLAAVDSIGANEEHPRAVHIGKGVVILSLWVPRLKPGSHIDARVSTGKRSWVEPLATQTKRGLSRGRRR